MKRLIIKKIKILKNIFRSRILLMGSISIFIFLLASEAHAQGNPATSMMVSLATILFYILQIVVKSMVFLASTLDVIFSIGVTTPSGTSIPAVSQTWTLVRNFSNMFFIIGLIVMAFATIFDVSKYNFRSMIVRFLIVALLINFSLTIGETIIDWTQSLSSVFLSAMGSYSNLLGGNIDPTVLLGEAGKNSISGALRPFFYNMGGTVGAVGVWATYAVDSHTNAQVIQMFFSIILGSIIAFSLLVGVIFTMVRIPILWALLILAPAAWVCSIFPPMTGMNRNWWKYFLGWNFFLPIYLFFLYIGVFFLQNQNNILPSGATDPLTGLGFSFQTLFFYAFVGMFMIYGVKFAMSGGIAAGAGGVAGAIWAKGRTTARFAGSLPGRGLGMAWRGTGAERVYKEGKETFKEQGFAGFEATEKNLGKFYQGQQGRDKAAAWLGEKTGLAPGLAEKQNQKNVQIAEQNFRARRYDQDKLTGIAKTGTLAEKIAATNILKSQNRPLNEDEIASIYTELKSESPVEAAKWIRTQKDTIETMGKSGLDKLEKVADVQMMQFIAGVKAKRDLISSEDEFKEKLKLFTQAGGNDALMANFIAGSKEFQDRLDPDRATAMLDELNKIAPDNKESIKKMANIIAKKGIETQKLMELTGAGGAFESPSEIEAFLNVAKEGNIVGTLEAKINAGVLRDLTTKKIIAVDLKNAAAVNKALEDALDQEYDRTNPKTLGSQQFREDKNNPSRNLGLADPRALAAFGRSYKNGRPERIADLYKSDDFVGNRPVFSAVEQTLKDISKAALIKDKLRPLEDAVTGILGLVSEIKKAKDANDNVRSNKFTTQAEGLLSKAERLDKSISSDTSFADEATKDTAGNLVANAKARLTEAKNYKKP